MVSIVIFDWERKHIILLPLKYILHSYGVCCNTFIKSKYVQIVIHLLAYIPGNLIIIIFGAMAWLSNIKMLHFILKLIVIQLICDF